MENQRIAELKKISAYVRTTALGTILNANNGHIGGNMSSVELLTALYFGGVFKFDPTDDKNEERDRVLIRGHEGPLRYTIFSLLDYIGEEELAEYRKYGSRLHGHEDMDETPGVDITPSGSLGMLLSYGVGSAIANKDKGLDSKTVVFLGDGEEQEGNICEAARHATTMNLNNLICIIDQNTKQLSRPTVESDGHDIRKIWEGYGWDVLEIQNGNDIEQVMSTYQKLSDISKPTLVIAHTSKGYGVKGSHEHYSGYHTLSSANDKTPILESYKEMREQLVRDGINFNTVRESAQRLTSKPGNDRKYTSEVDSNLFNINALDSTVSPQEAHEHYLMEVRKRLNIEGFSNIYYITPDLYRKPEVAELGYNEFMHFIDTGIREQHAIAMAHGISVENRNARICLCFGDAFIYRALDQVNAAAMGKSNMTIVGVWPGIQGAQNGKTHQTVGQPNAVMAIPELNFYEPADAVDMYNVFNETFGINKGINYVRLSKERIKIDRDIKDINNTGAYFVFKASENPDGLIISSGFTVQNAVEAAKRMYVEEGLKVNVINVVNHKRFSEFAPSLIVNDSPILAVYNGGPEVLANTIGKSIISNRDLPRPREFYSHGFLTGTTGKMNDLIKHYGFDSESIKGHALRLIRK